MIEKNWIVVDADNIVITKSDGSPLIFGAREAADQEARRWATSVKENVFIYQLVGVCTVPADAKIEPVPE